MESLKAVNVIKDNEGLWEYSRSDGDKELKLNVNADLSTDPVLKDKKKINTKGIQSIYKMIAN